LCAPITDVKAGWTRRSAMPASAHRAERIACTVAYANLEIIRAYRFPRRSRSAFVASKSSRSATRGFPRRHA
jgi:hypothetical protein